MFTRKQVALWFVIVLAYAFAHAFFERWYESEYGEMAFFWLQLAWFIFLGLVLVKLKKGVHYDKEV